MEHLCIYGNPFFNYAVYVFKFKHRLSGSVGSKDDV